jgi:hypothetical protein
MKYEVYTDIEVAVNFEIFDFVSIGRQGAIRKRVASEQRSKISITWLLAMLMTMIK